MARFGENSNDRRKIVYSRSATNEETAESVPIRSTQRHANSLKRVQHPADRSSIVVVLQRGGKVFLTLLFSLPCLLMLTVILPICWLIRRTSRFICRYRCTMRPCSCTYLAGSDLFWLYNSKNLQYGTKDNERENLQSQTTSPMAAAIFSLDGTVNENSLKKILMNRLITTASRRPSNSGEKLFARFSQIISRRFSGFMWIDDENFSIDEHVREIPRQLLNDEDLQSYVSSLVSTELPSSRPLWQLHYKNRSSMRPNDSVLIFLYHPVLSDGVSLLRILLKNVVDNRTTQLDLKPRFAGRHSEHILDYIKAYLFGHLLLFEKFIFNTSPETFPPASLTNNASKTIAIRTSRRSVVWSTPFSFTQANRMKLVTRTRMNDLLSTIILSCLKLYMEKRGLLTASKINCVMPCDLRSNTATIQMGNHLAHICLRLPLDIEGNIPMLWSFNEISKRMKQNGDYATMYLFTHLIYFMFPLCLANRITRRIYDKTNVWFTTVSAGSTTALSTMSISNRDVRSLICLTPSTTSSSINFCVTSYADEIRLSVSADSNLIPDLHFFTRCFNQQLTFVQELLAHRRIPGEIRRITRPPRFPPPKKSISTVSDESDDLSIEEIQTKMTTLQQELLSLKSQFENVDMTDPSSETQRLIITSKLEELRREFRELLIKLQERQCELSGMIPSDEEDEMDPQVRVRLRSASVASKISLKSNDQRQISNRINQFDRDNISEFSSHAVQISGQQAPGSSSKMNIFSTQAGMRRAQSVSICENTRVDLQRRTSLTRSRPATPARPVNLVTITTISTNTNNSNENGKNATVN